MAEYVPHASLGLNMELESHLPLALKHRLRYILSVYVCHVEAGELQRLCLSC